MTALQKFLEQIVLKKVEGSVYLVPAICDFQIEEALEEERKQGQNLPISNVSHQRELLVAFCKYLEKEGGIGFVSPEFLADDFLSKQ